MHKLSQQQRWPQGMYAYDGQKQLWIVGNFLSNKPTEYQVRWNLATQRRAGRPRRARSLPAQGRPESRPRNHLAVPLPLPRGPQVELEDESARTPGGAAARQTPGRRPPTYKVRRLPVRLPSTPAAALCLFLRDEGRRMRLLPGAARPTSFSSSTLRRTAVATRRPCRW